MAALTAIVDFMFFKKHLRFRMKMLQIEKALKGAVDEGEDTRTAADCSLKGALPQ